MFTKKFEWLNRPLCARNEVNMFQKVLKHVAHKNIFWALEHVTTVTAENKCWFMLLPLFENKVLVTASCVFLFAKRPNPNKKVNVPQKFLKHGATTFFKIKLWWLHRLFLQKGNPSEIKLTCFRSFWNMLLSPFIMQIGLFFRFSFLEKRQLFLTPFSKYLLVLASRHGNYTIFFWIAVNACICWESDVGTCNILKHSLRDQI